MTLRNLSVALLAASAATTFSSVLAVDSEICPTMYADFHNRQITQFSDQVFGLVEGGSAKHVPFVTLSEDGETATVVVGNGDEVGGVFHPMTASDDPAKVHWITHIMVKDQTGQIIALESMDPNAPSPATMTFDIPAGVTEMTAYEWCNLHGLWEGVTIPVPAAVVVARAADIGTCGISEFPKAAWPSVHADFARQQSTTFNATAPYTESDSEKHTPYITLSADAATGSILVGKPEGPMHPMNGSPDGVAVPHWITEVYVMDENDVIVAMKSLDSTGVDSATLEFDVPEGAESLQAYIWCNLHGLYTGPAVEVKAMSMTVEVDDNKTSGDEIVGSETTGTKSDEAAAEVKDDASSASIVGVTGLGASILIALNVM